ncbi:MAG: hypothetical protein J3K34DRAFT_247879 [Monoraphidium minutum]|nr:MAG: hypothetical protein J3K34DRAFT_247879 [Monoraphidium minutum]
MILSLIIVAQWNTCVFSASPRGLVSLIQAFARLCSLPARWAAPCPPPPPGCPPHRHHPGVGRPQLASHLATNQRFRRGGRARPRWPRGAPAPIAFAGAHLPRARTPTDRGRGDRARRSVDYICEHQLPGLGFKVYNPPRTRPRCARRCINATQCVTEVAKARCHHAPRRAALAAEGWRRLPHAAAGAWGRALGPPRRRK